MNVQIKAFCSLMSFLFTSNESCFCTFGLIDWVGWRLARGEHDIFSEYWVPLRACNNDLDFGFISGKILHLMPCSALFFCRRPLIMLQNISVRSSLDFSYFCSYSEA